MSNGVMYLKIDEYGYVRFNVVVPTQMKDDIREKCKEEKKNISEYVCGLAANLVVPDSKILKQIRIDRYNRDYRMVAKKYVKEIKESDNMSRVSGMNPKTSQFHLRVPAQVYQAIKAKADKMSMSVSDYIIFSITKYDIEEVSLKLDKTAEQIGRYNELLEKYNELMAKYNELLSEKKNCN